MGSRSVAERLLRSIEAGEVPVGSYLPPTRTLATKFGVSLNTIHAALRDLEGRRMIECRPRQGAIVCARTPIESSAPTAVQIGVITAMIPIGDARVEDWRYEWSTQIIHAAEKALFEAGHSCVLLQLDLGASGSLDEAKSRLDHSGKSLGGVLLFARPGAAELIKEFESRDLPWVTINPASAQETRNFVAADNHGGGRKVGLIFAQCGFDDVLVLSVNPQVATSDLEKVSGFFQGFIESGRSTQGVRTVACNGWQEMDSYRMVRQLLSEKYRPQAIFATGDMLATGAIHALRDAGLSVPRDVSVVGATGLTHSEHFDPPLTVLRQPMQEIGHEAAMMLRQMISEGTRKYAARRIPCELILRESLALPDAVRASLSAANPNR